MLTPGIEYFGASSDTEAVDFAEGRAATTTRLVRGDGVAPDGLLAALGSLLTGRAIDVLASEPELAVLAVEERDDGSVQLLRLPEALSDALAAATDAELLAVGRRALVFGELRGAQPELIAAFLAELAGLLRGGEHLYARVINGIPGSALPWARGQRLRSALPWAGVGLAILMVTAGIAVGTAHPGVYALGMLPVAGVLLSLSVGTLIRRRSLRGLAVALEASSSGSIGVIVDADARFLGRLPSIVADVLGDVEIPLVSSPGVLHLVGHPGGLDLVLGEGRALAFPADRVLAIAEAPVKTTRADFGSDGVVGGFAIVLRIDDQESVVWEVATYDSLGGRLTLSQLAPIAEAWALLTGAWRPGGSGSD